MGVRIILRGEWWANVGGVMLVGVFRWMVLPRAFFRTPLRGGRCSIQIFGIVMLDILFIIVAALFFAGCIAYAIACEKL
jgi:hypothetical protein